ncbi:MAG: 16S rRNA (cytidine(1402)-2'-O)-methyltransferase, partial [Verrucomicrobiota bacterium]
PIGNLGDITLRALDCLRSVDLAACEDTRTSGRLFKRYAIETRKISYHSHNEARRCPELVAHLTEGGTVALISDAGSPLISDPGQRLILACHQARLPVDVLPGPSSVITGLTGSGLPADSFHFGGFLPPKSGRRETILQEAIDRPETSVFFESPHRLSRSLECLGRLAPQRLLCVARELTKIHQEFRRGTPDMLLRHYTEKPPKGEITLLVCGSKIPKWMDPLLRPTE